MLNIKNALAGALVLFSVAAFASSVSEQAKNNAQQQLNEYIQVAKLSSNEQTQVFEVLLIKEQKKLSARKEHKGDKTAITSAIKSVNKAYNRQIKEIIGKERMREMNQHFKAQRAAK